MSHSAMSGLVPVCSNVSDSSRLVLTLYSADSAECSPELVLSPPNLVRRAPIVQLNHSHGHFSVTVSSGLLLLHQHQSTTAFCILVSIGIGDGDRYRRLWLVGKDFVAENLSLCSKSVSVKSNYPIKSVICRPTLYREPILVGKPEENNNICRR